MEKSNYKCVLKIKSDKAPCDQEGCRHFLNCKDDLNCAIVAAEQGPKTLQEIGDYYGISRMRICQIEKALLKKLKGSKNLHDLLQNAKKKSNIL